MTEKPRLGVSEALFLKPLLEGLDAPASQFDLAVDLPAALAVSFNNRPENLRGAFLSPIDYGRHGGEYQILPGISVSSKTPTGSAKLFVNDGTKNITRLAVDVRVTSEIILAKILLQEKFPNLSPQEKSIQFIPMMPDLPAMLKKADAALVASFVPQPEPTGEVFCMDLVEEWFDLTGLPYVHGFWVVREGQWEDSELNVLRSARDQGIQNMSTIASRAATSLSEKICREYLASFSYGLGPEEEEGISEFLRYSYYHGVLGDVPDLNFFSEEGTKDSQAG